MKSCRLFIFLLCLNATASAETFRATVGNTGCRTKQLTVRSLWAKVPGVRSVVILPRKSGDPPNRRVFVIDTTGPAVDAAALGRALGRRVGRYPILSFVAAGEAGSAR